MPTCAGIDFGTTNSVVTVATPGGGLASARIETRVLDVFRTVLCFWTQSGQVAHAAGPSALLQYQDDPFDTRLMMSLKTYLAQRSFSQTQVFGRVMSLEDLVGMFLRALLLEADLPPGSRIVAGRPVRFAGERADDAFGEARLREAYRRSGVGEVTLALEPVAAGIGFTRGLTAAATLLVGDFGGGTSDFSLLRFEPGGAQPVSVLGSTGLGIAGDTFDTRIIDQAIAPLLGKGGSYAPGSTPLPIPPEYYSGFAQWHRLSLMRAPRTLRDIAAVARYAAHPEQLHTLIRLIEDEAGYALYGAVSAAKTALSEADRTVLRFDQSGLVVERTIERTEFEGWIAPEMRQIGEAVDRLLQETSVSPAEIDRVFLTGGTSFVPAVRAVFTQRFDPARVSAGGEFTSVSEGLARMALQG